jgi:hypothetical protein
MKIEEQETVALSLEENVSNIFIQNSIDLNMHKLQGFAFSVLIGSTILWRYVMSTNRKYFNLYLDEEMTVK